MKPGQFAVCPSRAIHDIRMTNAALRILLTISCYGDMDRRSFPSLATIAEDMRVTKQAVHRQVQLLVHWGYLKVAARKRRNGSTTSNAYTLIMDADLPEAFDRGAIPEENEEVDRQPGVDAHVDAPSTLLEVDPTTLNNSLLTDSPHPPASQGGEKELFPEQKAEAQKVAGEIGRQILGERDREFEVFWATWPGASGTDPRKPAKEIFIRKRREHTFEAIMAGLGRDKRYWTATGKLVPMAQTWLSQERWIGKHDPTAPANHRELTFDQAKLIKSWAALRDALAHAGISMLQSDAARRHDFCDRNGINKILLQG